MLQLLDKKAQGEEAQQQVSIEGRGGVSNESFVGDEGDAVLQSDQRHEGGSLPGSDTDNPVTLYVLVNLFYFVYILQ
jgi:hypothetical protein